MPTLLHKSVGLLRKFSYEKPLCDNVPLGANIPHLLQPLQSKWEQQMVLFDVVFSPHILLSLEL